MMLPGERQAFGALIRLAAILVAVVLLTILRALGCVQTP
jgi:hypothetical protein